MIAVARKQIGVATNSKIIIKMLVLKLWRQKLIASSFADTHMIIISSLQIRKVLMGLLK